ncbi:sialidase family protein [Amnibacterium flavum]|nr:sialidase family protein [Amnibacterium flavum]
MKSPFRIAAVVMTAGLLALAPAFAASAVTQAAWAPASSVASDADDPVVASDGATIVTSWIDDSTPGGAIKFQVTTDGGATWSSITTLTAPNTYPDDVSVSVSGTTIGFAYFSGWNSDVMATVSVDAGSTFSQLVVVSGASQPEIAVAGSTATLAWIQSGTVSASTTSDGGVTWGAPAAVSAVGSPTDLHATRSTTSSTLAWSEFDSVVWADSFHTSVSMDGATWSSPAVVVPAGLDLAHIVQSGSTVTVVYLFTDPGTSDESIRVVRSADNGITWSAPLTLDSVVDADDPELTLNGARMAVAYTADGASGDPVLRVVSSTDGGATWGSPVVAFDGGGADIDEYRAFSLDDALVATYNVEVGSSMELRAISSVDGGLTWTAPVLYDSTGDGVTPVLVGFGNRVSLLWVSDSGELSRAVLTAMPDTASPAAAAQPVVVAPRLPDTGASLEMPFALGAMALIAGAALVETARMRTKRASD